MNNVFRSGRLVLVLHRWIGACAALFLLVLAATGLCLNHAERLGLHEKVIRLPVVLDRYNMETAEAIRSLRMSPDLTVSELQGSVFVGSHMLESVSGRLIGVQAFDQLFVAALDRGVVLLTVSGDFIEYLPVDSMPFGKLVALGETTDGGVVLITDEGNWKADTDWLEFVPYDGPVSVDPPEWIELTGPPARSILEAYNGRGPTLYRVLLDLHAGRLFGWGGRTLMDLTAVAIVFLVVSGLVSWLRRLRGPTRRVR